VQPISNNKSSRQSFKSSAFCSILSNDTSAQIISGHFIQSKFHQYLQSTSTVTETTNSKQQTGKGKQQTDLHMLSRLFDFIQRLRFAQIISGSFIQSHFCRYLQSASASTTTKATSSSSQVQHSSPID
jgi:hypothetical protein